MDESRGAALHLSAVKSHSAKPHAGVDLSDFARRSALRSRECSMIVMIAITYGHGVKFDPTEVLGYYGRAYAPAGHVRDCR